MDLNATTTDGFVSLAEAARLLPGRPHAASLWRWARLGVSTHSGERVRLRVGRLGRKLVTRPEWLSEFSQRCAEADLGRWGDTPRSESPEHRQAVGELRRRGAMG